MDCERADGTLKRPASKAGRYRAYPMYCLWRRAVALAFWNLKSSSAELVRCVYPPINVLGLVAMPAGTVLLLCATVAWISVFTLGPTLLIFVWMGLQPYRLWLFLKSRMTGRNFFV